MASMVLHSFERAMEVLRFYREFTASQPDELQTWAGILTGPDGNLLVALIPCYVGSLDEGERILAPLRRFGSPLADTVAPLPYVAVQSMFDAALPPGRLDYWKTGLTNRLDDEVSAATVEYAQQAPSPLSVILFAELHGAYSRVGKTDTAYYHRDLQYDPIALSIWTDPADSPCNVRWARELFAAWEPHLPRGVCERPGRRGRGAGAERLRRELCAAGGAQDQVRFDQRLPSQPEHQADGVTSSPHRGIRGCTACRL
jgi:hypothetical protein